MILRRVIAHFKKQEWTAIFLDFLIVVMGVFIGIQVSNWNSARLERERAQAYGERLKEDLRYEAWQYEYMISYYKEVFANAERTIGALTYGRPLSDQQLLINAYRATQFTDYPSRRATFDEMVAAGVIGLVSDNILRETALAFYNDPNVNSAKQDAKVSDYRKAFRRAMPARVQRGLVEACGDRDIEVGNYATVSGSLDYPCSLDLPTEEISAAAAKLRADPEIIATLQLRYADLDTLTNNLEQGTPGLRENLQRVAGHGLQ